MYVFTARNWIKIYNKAIIKMIEFCIDKTKIDKGGVMMNKKKVLIVDDDKLIRNMISEYIAIDEYESHKASNGVEALDLLSKNEYSIIILDVMMPIMDGWITCKEIRKNSDIPIIMLSARGEEYDKLLGFELGVDDYIVKPFSLKELLARIKAITRRYEMRNNKAEDKNKFIYKDITINFESRDVFIREEHISLTPKEYELLSYFINNPNRVFSREQLLNNIWGYEFLGDNRTVDTHVKMLRESLKEYRKLIVTAWGIGYKFEIGIRK